ncbi:DUF3558 domain-containing protein [Amycolatopsis xylanica]|uniref:DUF3558 domain-containing protein n=1 Tax=Amycolatopsis xylanica TaxID=589385 RepID=UPI00159FEC7F|nr:DUF3558 domain-containing protein [Amycolatopsis xylanica]
MLLAVGLVLSGCSKTTPGNAATVPPSSPGTSASDPAVPQVSDPLEVSKFEQDPCKALTADQARELASLATTNVTSGTAGPICGWRDGDRNEIAFGFVHANGLADSYRNHQPDDPGYFVPVPSVAGYPGVFASISDGRPDGVCTLAVGVRNDVVMTVTSLMNSSSPYRKDPCPLVQRAAEAAIATIKGAK